MIPRNRRAVHVLGAGLAAIATAACGQQAATNASTPDLSDLATFVRWGGVSITLLLVVAAVVVLRIVRTIAVRLGKEYASQRPLIGRLESWLRFSVYLAVGVVGLKLSFRVDQQVFLFVGGGVALAIGFALRDIIAALVAGIVILLARPFQVGDRVRYGDNYGDVMSIGLHSVRLRTPDEIIVTVPNHKLLSEVTASPTHGSVDMAVPMEFFIGIDQDAELAARLVRESLLTSRYVYLDETVTTSLSQVLLPNGYAALRILGQAHVHDSCYERAFQTDVTKRVMRAFHKHGVQPPAMLHRVVMDRPKREPRR